MGAPILLSDTPSLFVVMGLDGFLLVCLKALYAPGFPNKALAH
jgi:hypothetical protein